MKNYESERQRRIEGQKIQQDKKIEEMHKYGVAREANRFRSSESHRSNNSDPNYAKQNQFGSFGSVSKSQKQISGTPPVMSGQKGKPAAKMPKGAWQSQSVLIG